MGIEQWLDTGTDIVNAVTDAIETGNFNNLSKDIERSVNNAVQVSATEYKQRMQNYSAAMSAERKKKQVTFFKIKPSKADDWLRTIIGGVGAVFNGLFSAAMLSEAFSGYGMSGDIIASIFFAVLTAVFCRMAYKGTKGRKITDSFYQYGNIVGTREYIPISEICNQTGETKKTVVKNLREMIKLGYLPEAKFDDTEDTLMLSNNLYNEYRKNSAARAEAENELKKAKEEAIKKGEAYPDEVQEILEEGDAYLKTIKRCNQEIPDKVMTDKLNRMEQIMARIFEQVRKDPSTAGDLRKLIEYYLPTTAKLLNAYIDLEKQPEVGDNIKNTKIEIENTLDTINDAFEKLLDSMFEDMAWDISSDINVMKNMMAQDGLTETNVMGGTVQNG